MSVCELRYVRSDNIRLQTSVVWRPKLMTRELSFVCSFKWLRAVCCEFYEGRSRVFLIWNRSTILSDAVVLGGSFAGLLSLVVSW